MEESNINPFALQVNVAPSIIPELELSKDGTAASKMEEYNPFKQLVNKQDLSDPNQDLRNSIKQRVAPLVASTYNVQNYLKRGYELTDLDLGNANLEQDLSSTQGKTERFMNNLKVAGANFASMAVSTFLTTPADMVKFDSSAITDDSVIKSMFDSTQDIAENNRNFETRNDVSDDLWTNITNWLPFAGNSTKGFGKILESTAFGLGAGLGIAGQEALITLATGGIGTIPALAANIQKLLNSSKYLEKALKVSRLAEEGANGLSKIVKAGEITNGIAKGLKTVYRSQLGSYSEALFEGLEGKETLKKELISDYENIHGFKPEGEELAKIEQDSTDAGITRMNVNRALLSVTNFSQFNSIFKSFDAAREGAEAAAEKYGSKVILDDAGKAIVSGSKKLPKWFDSGVGKYLKPLAQAGRNMKSGDIVKESLQEGMEEGLQFFTDKALNNYYTWKHYGDNKTIGDALQVATDELFTKEGLESIFTGMLAGGGQTAVSNFITNISRDIKDNITERNNQNLKEGELPEVTFRQSKKDYEVLQNQYAETYNELDEKVKNINQEYKSIPTSIKKKLDNIFNNDSVGGTVLDKLQQANASTKLLEIKNAPADEEQYNQALTHEFFTLAVPYAKNGNIDILLEQFKEYKNLDESSFQSMFNTNETETKNKDKVIDLYLEEFKKIQKSYKRVDNAFQRTRNNNMSSNVYNTLKTELAFSFYNNDRLIETAKELEQGIGKDYVDMLSNIITTPNKSVVKNKATAKNKTEIARIEALGELATENDKQKSSGLQQMNEFLDSMSTSTTHKDVEKAIYNNLIKPYNEEKGIADTYDLEEKLNKIYYLNKVKERVKDNQDKINAILLSNNPEEYIQKKEEQFRIEQQRLKNKDLKKKIEEQAEIDRIAEEERLKNNPVVPVPNPLQTDAQRNAEFAKNKIKEELRKQINALADNLLYITHVTSDNNAKVINESNLKMSAGASSTVVLNTKEQLGKVLEDIIDGNSPHRSYSDVFIGAIDKTVLDANTGKTIYDKLENYLTDNYQQDTALSQLPTDLNYGYFTQGKLTLNNLAPVVDTKLEDLIGETNNIESKDQELVYIVDKDGNIVSIDSKEAEYRARTLIQVINNYESMSDFKDKLELSVWNSDKDEAIAFKDEGYFLYKKAPKSGVNISYNDGSMGMIPLERELYVDADEFTRITKLNVTSELLTNVKEYNKGIASYVNKNVISYSSFLEILANDRKTEIAVRKANFILNIKDKDGVVKLSPSISDLKNNHSKYINFSNKVKDNIDKLDNVRDFILDQLDILATITGKPIGQDFESKNSEGKDVIIPALIPLTDLIDVATQKPPMVQVTSEKLPNGEYTFTSSIISGKFGNYKKAFDEKFAEYIKKEPFEGSKIYTFLVNHNNKWFTGDTVYIVSAQQRPLSAYKNALGLTFETNEKLLEYLQKNTAGVIDKKSITNPNADKATMKFEDFEKTNSLQITIEYEKEQIKLKDATVKHYIKYNEFAGMNLKQITDYIKTTIENKNQENSEKNITFDFFKSAETIEGSYTDYSAILVNNHFKRNSFQVYSSLMLKIIPNEQQANEPVIKISEDNNDNVVISTANSISESFDEEDNIDQQAIDTNDVLEAMMASMNQAPTSTQSFSEEDFIDDQAQNTNDIMAAFLANRNQPSVVPVPVVPVKALTSKEQLLNNIQEDLKSIGFAFSNEDVITPTGVNKGTFLNILNGLEESKIIERLEKIQIDSKPLYIKGKLNNLINSVSTVKLPPQLIRNVGIAKTRIENNNKQQTQQLINNCINI